MTQNQFNQKVNLLKTSLTRGEEVTIQRGLYEGEVGTVTGLASIVYVTLESMATVPIPYRDLISRD